MTRIRDIFSKLVERVQCLYIRHFGPSLRQVFEEHNGNLIYKWDHYIDAYELHLAKFRGKRFTLVEIGVFQGGSLQLWRKYFGPRVTIYGIDVDSRCNQFMSKNTQIVLGDQADPGFWARFKAVVPRVDVLIDDGGHHVHQQIVTFEEMFETITPGGIYICEDLHTNYWREYGGNSEGASGTFISRAKELIDSMNYFHRKNATDSERKLGSQIRSISCYESMIVFQKDNVPPPHERTVGKPIFSDSAQMVAGKR